VAQRVGRVIALLFHDRGTRRRWVVSRTPRSHFTTGKQTGTHFTEVGWAPGPVRMGGKSLPHRHSIPDRLACVQSLYRLSYPAHYRVCICTNKQISTSQSWSSMFNALITIEKHKLFPSCNSSSSTKSLAGVTTTDTQRKLDVSSH